MFCIDFVSKHPQAIRNKMVINEENYFIFLYLSSKKSLVFIVVYKMRVLGHFASDLYLRQRVY